MSSDPNSAPNTAATSLAPAEAQPNPREAKRMRAIGHKLHPVVTVSERGVSDAVLAELDRALTDHELIKVRLNLPREARGTALKQLTTASRAYAVQTIGRVALLLRRTAKPKAHLSNLVREF